MEAGAAGVRGRPAAGKRWRGVDSAPTQRLATEAWSAGDFSRSLLSASERVL